MIRAGAYASALISILGDMNVNPKLKAVATSVAVSLVFGIFACSSDNNPAPLPTMPTPAVSESVEISEAPTPPQITRNGSGPAIITDEPKPDEATPARPPAVEFAQRWGTKYPDIPEYAILKAANITCRAIEAAGDGWNKDPLVVAALEIAVQDSGLSQNDAVEFAQDAEQNYCASVVNPT